MDEMSPLGQSLAHTHPAISAEEALSLLRASLLEIPLLLIDQQGNSHGDSSLLQPTKVLQEQLCRTAQSRPTQTTTCGAFHSRALPLPDTTLIFSAVADPALDQSRCQIITLATDLLSQTIELRRLTSKLHDLRHDLDQTRNNSRAKSDFLATMSHEIRTPMNGVLGFAEILMTSKLDEEQAFSVRAIKTSGESLLELINSLLDFSKIESGEMHLEAMDFDPEITARDVCDLLRPKPPVPELTINCRIDPQVPAKITGDPTRFKQVLINLVGNAIKFTSRGEVELTITVDAEDQDHITLHTSVRDSGIGIPPERLELIFDPYKQAQEATTRNYGGTGLGLSIARKLAGLMNGRIWAESTPGQGSTFHFTSVMARCTQAQAPDIQGGNLQHKRVLIIDSNPISATSQLAILTEAGLVTTCLSDASQTLNALHAAEEKGTPYDLAICELNFPTLSAPDLARQIRESNLSCRTMPLLVYTNSTEKAAARCHTAGFNGFLAKPARNSILFKTLAALLTPQASDPSTGHTRSLITQYSIRERLKQSTHILLAKDNPVNRKMAEMMLTRAGYRVSLAETGQQLLDLFTQEPALYDIILTDIRMPDMDGYEAVRHLRAQGHSEIPIIAMTASAMTGDREKCLAAGMNDYISKPIKRDTIFGVLDTWLYARQSS